MSLSSLTVIFVSEGPHGVVETRQETKPLTEAALLSAGVLLISGIPDDAGRRVVALRASVS